jgi:alpha-galactosidase
MDKLPPDALLLNYVNPMAANCWAVDAGTGRPHVGFVTVFSKRVKC